MTDAMLGQGVPGAVSVRVPFRAWMFLEAVRGTEIGLVVELSAGGAEVVSAGPFSTGDTLAAHLMLADGRSVACDVQVVHAAQNRFRLRFLAMPRTYVEAFDYLVGPGEFSRYVPQVRETVSLAAFGQVA